MQQPTQDQLDRRLLVDVLHLLRVEQDHDTTHAVLSVVDPVALERAIRMHDFREALIERIGRRLALPVTSD